MTLHAHPTDAVADLLATYADAGADAAYLACDRHDPEATAFVLVGDDLVSTRFTYGELAEESRRLAGVLQARGVRRGDRVPVLLGKRRELPVTLLALWRLGAVHVPLFTAFATGAIRMRVEGSDARVVVTEPSQREKLDPLNGLDVLEVGPDLDRAMSAATPLAERVAVGADGTIMQLFTSGTTGHPKPVAVPLRALASFHAYMQLCLDVRADDVFWNAADPGWAYGLYYGLAGPLVTGAPTSSTPAGSRRNRRSPWWSGWASRTSPEHPRCTGRSARAASWSGCPCGAPRRQENR